MDCLTFFRIDLEELLDESVSLQDHTTITPMAHNEKPETFCGKSCSQCEYQEKLGCKGCQDGDGRRYGGCRLAQCCRDHLYESCQACADQSNCDKLRNIPEQMNSKKKHILSVQDKIERRAPILGKWLFVLLGMTLLQTLTEILLVDEMKVWCPWLHTFGFFLYAAVGVA